MHGRRVKAAVSSMALVAAATCLAGCRIGDLQKTTYAAEVRRTSYGIAHVRANDEAGIGYGMGYAYAEDNVCMLAEEIVTVNGERSRYFGGDAVGGPDVDSGSIDAPNLQSDFFFKYLNSPPRVSAAWSRQSPAVQALMRGYAAGFNRFLGETGVGGLPAACRNAPWVRRITAEDLVRFVRRLTVETDSLWLLKGLVAARPPTKGGDDAARSHAVAQSVLPHTMAWSERLRRLGSNAVALGRDATENGRGLLLGNPHYPWLGSLRFYQVHATIPGKLDVMGVTLGGLPVVVIGFNRHLAWTHTVNTSGHSSLYALQLTPGDPTKYRIDGVVEAMRRETVTVDVRGRDGAITRASHDFWISRHGPIVVLPDRLDWSATQAYALRDANFDNHRLIDTWYDMNRAGSLDELERAIEGHLGLPWVNTIAVDEHGETLYTDVTVVPHLSRAQYDSCIPAAQEKLLEERLLVLRAEAECEWNVDPAAPQAGIFAARDLPVLRRTDFVQNSNDSAWLTNPAARLTGFAPIVSRQDYPQNDRTRIGLGQIEARLAGADGLAGNRFDAGKLQRIAFSNRSYFGSLLHDDLLHICEDTRPVALEGRDVAVKQACAAFRGWDMHANLDSTGYPLASAWLRGLEGRDEIWRVPFTAQDPVNTPRGIRLDDPRAVLAVREELARAVLQLREQRIDPAKPWGEIQAFERNGQRIPIPGGDAYNAIVSKAADGVANVWFGTSYALTVTFDERGPQARAILAYSQSSDPASPHFADQVPRFSASEWIDQPYADGQIEADPHFRSRRISE
ncbi:MAG: penicillin acylase family protein [Steroidobacteraceae bacterium]